VLEVIEAVKRVSGVNFKVEIAERRPGDPARVVADCRTARATIGWHPRFDNLSTIVAHTLAWQQKLKARRTNHQDSGG
jgi:UDP-glucose 4-epimerase